jgi:hypothetical protein
MRAIRVGLFLCFCLASASGLYTPASKDGADASAAKAALELNRSIVIEDRDWLKSIDLKDGVLTYVWHTVKPGRQHAMNVGNYDRHEFTKRLTDDELARFGGWIDDCKVFSLPTKFEKEDGPGYAVQWGTRFLVSRGESRYEKALDGRGEIPEEFGVARRALERLCEQVRDGARTDLAPELKEKRDKLLAQADAAIRKGLLELGEKYPQMKKAGRSWDRVSRTSEPGRIGIHVYYSVRPKGANAPAGTPEKEQFGVLVVIQPPPEEPVQLVMSVLHPKLGLVGQVGTSAGDPELAAALKKLVDDALRPLADLDAAVDPLWGEAVEGVQVRLVADKVQWKADEWPILRAEIRNEGTRNLVTDSLGEYADLEVDGEWFNVLEHLTADVGPGTLAPGARHDDITILFNRAWQTGKDKRRLKLAPGKHTVRVAFTAQPTDKDAGEPIRIISNAVEIEILPAEAK